MDILSPLQWGHQHRSFFRCQRHTTRHIHGSRVTLLEFDCCYPSSILVSSHFPLSFLTFQTISQVSKWPGQMGIFWALQLRCFHWRTWQCAVHSSPPWSAGLQAREGYSHPYVLVQRHPPCKLRYCKALANLFTFWECFKIYSWTSTLHTFLPFPIYFKTLPPISAVNGAHKKPISWCIVDKSLCMAFGNFC